jgi:hypothetical protein
MQARPTDLLLLHHRDVETGQPASESRGVPSRATTDDDDIELLGRGDHLLGERRPI